SHTAGEGSGVRAFLQVQFRLPRLPTSMDDLLKNLTIGLFAFLIVHRGLEDRARHATARQVREAFDNTGSVWEKIEPRGMLGLFASDVWAVDIYGKGIRTERLPFSLYPRPGWKGSIRHLRLHLTDFTLAGLPIDRFEADVPFVTYDIGHALWKDRIVLRDAGTGCAEVRVSAQGLRSFLLRKYETRLSDVLIWQQNRKIYLRGTFSLFAAPLPFVASGRFAPRAGRYIDLIEPTFFLNRAPATPQMTEFILKQINPVLDTERDLGLGGFFTIETVEIGEDGLRIRGQTTIPPASETPMRR